RREIAAFNPLASWSTRLWQMKATRIPRRFRSPIMVAKHGAQNTVHQWNTTRAGLCAAMLRTVLDQVRGLTEPIVYCTPGSTWSVHEGSLSPSPGYNHWGYCRENEKKPPSPAKARASHVLYCAMRPRYGRTGPTTTLPFAAGSVMRWMVGPGFRPIAPVPAPAAP